MARVRVGGAAAEHLFSVACGLDSMAVGEPQIVAQIKAAARDAAAAGTTGPATTGLIDAALRASKRARTETTISTKPSLSPGPALTSPTHTSADSRRETPSCSGPAAWAGSLHGCSAEPVSGGCRWPVDKRCEPLSWPRQWAAINCGPAMCQLSLPMPTSWSSAAREPSEPVVCVDQVRAAEHGRRRRLFLPVHMDAWPPRRGCRGPGSWSATWRSARCRPSAARSTSVTPASGPTAGGVVPVLSVE